MITNERKQECFCVDPERSIRCNRQKNYQLKSLNYLANTLLIEQEGLFANVHYNQSPIGEKKLLKKRERKREKVSMV